MLTLQNIDQETVKIFKDYAQGNTQSLSIITCSLEKPKNPMDVMIKKEFEFSWNKLFSDYIIVGGNNLNYPSSVEQYPSLWMMAWSDYFDKKFKSFKTPLRQFDLNQIMDEKNRLISSFSPQMNENQFETIANKILENIPYDKKDTKKYQISLKNMVFNLAKIDFFNHKESTIEQDISNVLKSFYSSFDHSDNIVFKTSLYQFGKNFNIEQIKKDKIDYFEPKNKEEALFFSHLSKNKTAFSKAFNSSFGISDDKYQLDMEDLFYKMIVENNYNELSEKLPLKTEIKKTKVKKI